MQFGFCFMVWCSDVDFIGIGVLRLFCYVGLCLIKWVYGGFVIDIAIVT